MPSYVVKPVRDDDFYVIWSTIVDAPTAFGDRAEVAEMRDVTEDRLQRADANGTSAFDADIFGYADQEFLLHNVDFKGWRNDRAYFVPRTNLKELCRRIGADEDVGDLLRSES